MSSLRSLFLATLEKSGPGRTVGPPGFAQHVHEPFHFWFEEQIEEILWFFLDLGHLRFCGFSQGRQCFCLAARVGEQFHERGQSSR